VPSAPAQVRHRLLGVLRTQRALVGIVAAGFVARLLWVIVVDSPDPVGDMALGDQFSYYYYGLEIAEGRGYVSYTTGQPTAYYPIGYPAILAVLFWFVAHTPFPDDYLLAAQLLNVVLSTATIVFAFLIARRLFGRRAGLISAGIVACFPNLVFNVGTLQLETTFIFLCLAALAVLVTHDWADGPPSTRRLLAFGALLGVSILVRPFSLLFLLAVLVAALVAGYGWRRAMVVAAIPLGVVVAMSAPWVVRNAIRLDAFVPTSTNTGDTVCLDRFDDANGDFRWADHEGCADPLLPEVERNTTSTRMAIRYVIDNPGRELVQIGRRARLIFATDRDGLVYSNLVGHGDVVSPSTARTLGDVADGFFHVVTVLGAAGVVVAIVRRRRRPETVLILVSLASLLAVPLLLWGAPRFHLPFSPLLAVMAGGVIGVAVDRWRRPTDVA